MTAHSAITGLESGHAAGIAYLRRTSSRASRTLVLLHGIGSNAQSFVALMKALPASFDAIAWNAPGYGDSAPLPTAAPASPDYAQALARMLDALSVQRAVLAGHSLGALFAASFAVRHPNRVTAIALLSPAPGYRCGAGTALPPAVQSRIDEIRELGPAGFAAKRAARLVGDPEGQPKVVAAVERAMASVHPEGYIQAARALGAGDLLADAARISAPTVVAVGTLDQITPSASVRRAYEAFGRKARYQEIPGAGHALPQEQPEVTARLIAKLVERLT